MKARRLHLTDIKFVSRKMWHLDKFTSKLPLALTFQRFMGSEPLQAAAIREGFVVEVAWTWGKAMEGQESREGVSGVGWTVQGAVSGGP